MVFPSLPFRRHPSIAATEQADSREPDAPRPPSLALALGGGAARGWSHIGVLRTLEAAGIRPDIIAGTSIGAVVGGCWAAGRLDDLEAWARSLTRRRMFGVLDVSLAGAGLIGGGKLRAQLESQLGETRIEDLAARFVAISTEYGTGHEVWLGRGDLALALRASYALPGVFEPVRVGGRWLMDGALVNPVPVSAARALGGRVVVAVGLQSEISPHGAVIQTYEATEGDDAVAAGVTRARRRLRLRRNRSKEGTPPPAADRAPDAPGIARVMVQAYNITQDRISRSRLAGDPPDVMIGPRLSGIGLFEFHRAEEAIRLGAEAAERSLDAIRDALRAFA
ncbi:patatin-like phospholipase family protein [Methylopila sp. Yamaguchi]|uniref:patatin-like phospholipase family protein n=1 Tax=Methylopila sp. Yamaguchi TaxID=1437817 RepID=UPI000CCC3715|nr:patatin-like phospholipase family protein [Methylopila sp. Yamaguchi]